MKVVIYARCSTKHHDQNPEVQLQEMRKYCIVREWTICEEIVDHGISGGTEVRPGLRRLFTLVRSREVDCVIVVKLDRLFRSLKHLITTLDEFQSVNVQFISLKDNLDLGTSAGRLMMQIIGAFGEFERSLIRERTIAGLIHARENGTQLGRPKTRNDRAILEARANGLSYREIQRKLGVSRGAIYRALKGDVPKTPQEAA